MVRSPLFERAASLCLPPVDFCSGVSPSQAAKSRPARKPSGAGTRAVIAVAAIGPMPGIVMSRRATGSALARRAISPSSSLSCSSKALSVLISTCRIPRALSGTDDFGSSTSATRRSTCAGPGGTTWPYSARCPRKALMHCVRCRTSRSRARNTTVFACCASSFTGTKRIPGRCADRLSIRHIILLPLDEGLHISGWDQPHRVAQLAKLPRPVVRPATSLQRHKTGLLPREKLEHLGPHQALAEHHPAGRIGPVRLKYPLRNIKPYRASLAHGRLPRWLLNTTTLAHRCRRGASTPSRCGPAQTASPRQPEQANNRAYGPGNLGSIVFFL